MIITNSCAKVSIYFQSAKYFSKNLIKKFFLRSSHMCVTETILDRCYSLFSNLTIISCAKVQKKEIPCKYFLNYFIKKLVFKCIYFNFSNYFFMFDFNIAIIKFLFSCININYFNISNYNFSLINISIS